MNLLFVIDSLGAGGAQRQMVTLAVELQNRGHRIEFFNYYPEYDFFRSILVDARITIHDYYKPKSGFSLSLAGKLRHVLRVGRYEAVLAFLEAPSLYAIVAARTMAIPVIVSDRNSYLKYNTTHLFFKRQVFRLAHRVVTNSYSQRRWLIERARLPGSRVDVVYNGYDPEQFPFSPLVPERGRDLKLLAIGRINPQKNIELLITALSVFSRIHGWCPAVTWIGSSHDMEYRNRIDDMLRQSPAVSEVWKWIPESRSLSALFSKHHALVLPSHYEGLPNVACEALFAGKPVLISDVCDHSMIVKDGERGFLFDPSSAESLVHAVELLIETSKDRWYEIAQNCRAYAEQNLSSNRMTDRYEAAIAILTSAERRK